MKMESSLSMLIRERSVNINKELLKLVEKGG